MSVYWTRASHPDLPDVVLPAAAMESYPEWEAIGEPSTDVDALRAELEREQVAARMEALIAASAPAPEPAAPEFDPEPESPTPSGADPKEQ